MEIQSKKLVLSVCLFAFVCFAQTDRAIITGTVTDSSGAAVPGARVVATHPATNVATATETTSTGDFTIPTLTVGTYQLRIEKQGFKSAVRSDIVLTAGNTVTVNAILEVGAVSESVQVQATLDQLETSTAKVST